MHSVYGFEGMNGMNFDEWIDVPLLLTLMGDHTGWSLWTWHHCCSRCTRYALWYHETIGGCELFDLKISAPTGDPHQRQYVFICKSVAIWLLQLDTSCTYLYIPTRNVLDQAFTFTIFHQRWSSLASLAVPCSPPRSAAPEVAPFAPLAPGVSSTEPQRWVLWMSIPPLLPLSPALPAVKAPNSMSPSRRSRRRRRPGRCQWLGSERISRPLRRYLYRPPGENISWIPGPFSKILQYPDIHQSHIIHCLLNFS